MSRLVVPRDLKWEMIVVNNNCSDETDAVIARHAGRLPIRRLFECQPGKSFAANRAIAESNGDLLIWTDDDVLVEPDWLAAFCAAAHQHPDVMFFGGVVEPWFATRPPQWIERNLAYLHGVYAIRRFGPDSRPVDSTQLPFGVSLAIRRSAFAVSVFDTRIGPRENSQIRGEETELLRRFMTEGLSGRWVPTARLRHYIPAERLTFRYVWRFFVGLSRTDVRVRPVESDKRLFGWPRWALRCYLQYSAKALCLSFYRGRRWLRAIQGAAWAKGIMEESRAGLADARSSTNSKARLELDTLSVEPFDAAVN